MAKSPENTPPDERLNGRAPSTDLKPGTRLRYRHSRRVVVLARRKDPNDPRHGLFHPGWWLEENQGGLADFVIDAEDSDWHVIGDRRD